jgi:predicted permease
MRSLFRRLQYMFRERQISEELREELEFHRGLAEERLIREGVPPADAAAESRRVMGNIALASEDARGLWVFPWLDALRQDVGYSFRQLVRQPGFAFLAIGTLAAGIGLNTSLFTVFSALAIRPWPVSDPDRVVNVFNMSSRDLRARHSGGPRGFSLDEAEYLRTHAKTLAGIVATRSGGGDQTLGQSDVPASWVSGSYFDVLGIKMAHGRGFTAAEDRDEASAAVAVLSHAYWRREFGADPSIVGRQVRFEDVPFTIVGVTDAGFTGTRPNRVDVWLPIASASLLRPTDRWVQNVARKPANCCVALAARLTPGTTREQAEAELTLLDRQYREARAITSPEDGVEVTGTQFAEGPKGDPTGSFLPMFAGVVLVLLLACANVGNLLIARAAARRREIAVRLSLGASRARVIRQLLTEGVVLAAAAGIVGLWTTLWLPEHIVQLTSGSTALQLTPDATVLAFTVGISILACLAFALAPAVHGTRIGVAGALKDGTPLASAPFRLRGVLLSVQVAAVVVLLTGAGLLVRAIDHALSQDFGFDLEGLSVASTEVPARGFDQPRTRTVAMQLAADLEPLDGRRLALTSTPPLGSGNIKGSFTIPGRSEEENNSVYEVSPGYFAITGLQLVAGRLFTSADANQPLIVINEAMARRYWSVQDAVGRVIVCEGLGAGWNRLGQLQIIGVVRDAYMTSTTSVGSTIYQPLSGRTLPHILFRRDDREAAAAASGAAARIDTRLHTRVRPLAENLEPQLRAARSAALLASSLGLLGLLLASVGLFGVFANWVQQRTQEIGIRMALGARAANVVGLVFRSSGGALAAGLLLGGAGTAASTRVLQSYLMGLSPLDPVAYAGVAGVLLAAGALATYLPARRAMRVDPIRALRCE